jgi:DNA-binding PadR family transcriptional regulator
MRARRGDIRSAVLTLLAEEPMHGYQIIQELGERSGGAWNPSPGSVYPTLQLLEDEGLVKATERDGKRVFEITDAGTKALAERKQDTPPWEQFGEGMSAEKMRLLSSMKQAGAAAMQVIGAGSPDQQTRVADALDEARKKIYGILAEDA